MTLTAAAHLTMQPIIAISHSDDVGVHDLVATPPIFVSEDAWGEPIYLAHFGAHYEGTQPKGADLD